MQADTPAPTASTFSQPIQPPPPPGIAQSSGPIIPVGRPGPGVGTGIGNGFKNLFDLASLDQPPVPRVQVKPLYPYEMSRAGINGRVVVGFIVDSEGSVRNPYVISSTHREFEPEALRAVVRWKFKPGRKNGANVSTSNVHLPFDFTISGN
jgi:protein TonB